MVGVGGTRWHDGHFGDGGDRVDRRGRRRQRVARQAGAYQVGATPADSSRDEPDVAAIAGGNGGGHRSTAATSAVLGTSAATPIWAGMYAVVLQQKAPAGKGFTNALEQIYTLGKAGHGFHDITTGTQVGSERHGHRRLRGRRGLRPRHRLGHSEPHQSDRELAVRKDNL